MLLGRAIDRLLGRDISREVKATRHRIDLMTERVEHLVATNQRLEGELADARYGSERWQKLLRSEIAKVQDCGLTAIGKGCGAQCVTCARSSNDGWMARAKAAEAALATAEGYKHDFEMYARAWLRELGGKVFHKTHHIDSLTKTTEWMRHRSDRFEVTHGLVKKALGHLTAIPPDYDAAKAVLTEASK